MSGFSFVSPMVAELVGDSGTTDFQFPIGGSGPANIFWAVGAGSGGAPASAADFVGGAFPSGMLTFGAGDTTQTINVPVVGAARVAPDLTFDVTAWYYNLPPEPGFHATTTYLSASGLIVNADSDAPTYAVAALAADRAVGGAGITPYTFSVTRARDAGSAATLGYAVVGSGVAPVPAQLIADPTGSVVFAAGATSATITIDVVGQTVLNGPASFGAPETFTLTLSGPDGTVITGPTATGTVEANVAHIEDVTNYANDTVVTDSVTGAVLQTLPPIDTSAMQFLSAGGIQYGRNLASAETLGLDPSQLRDYDGNNLGAASGWELEGLASVRAGANPSYILVNPVIGRWAEVAEQPGGNFNFANYGQNGDTRVVGTYIDPSVASGQIAAGSALDSAARLQSDLKAGRLALLGSVDYSTDSYLPQNEQFVDVFFKLTNHSADHHDDVYLRAIMHLDGNIQYANYMNTSQFNEFMASAETPYGVYANWMTGI